MQVLQLRASLAATMPFRSAPPAILDALELKKVELPDHHRVDPRRAAIPSRSPTRTPCRTSTSTWSARIDKQTIASALKSGSDVPGVVLSNSPRRSR